MGGFFDDMIAKRNRVYEAIVTLRDYAADLVAKNDAAMWSEPKLVIFHRSRRWRLPCQL